MHAWIYIYKMKINTPTCGDDDDDAINYVQSPNLVGSPLGILQLLLYCKYRKRANTNTNTNTQQEKANQLALVVNTEQPHLK